jgi:hypothetical protein
MLSVTLIPAGGKEKKGEERRRAAVRIAWMHHDGP